MYPGAILFCCLLWIPLVYVLPLARRTVKCWRGVARSCDGPMCRTMRSCYRDAVPDPNLLDDEEDGLNARKKDAPSAPNLADPSLALRRRAASLTCAVLCAGLIYILWSFFSIHPLSDCTIVVGNFPGLPLVGNLRRYRDILEMPLIGFCALLNDEILLIELSDGPKDAFDIARSNVTFYADLDQFKIIAPPHAINVQLSRTCLRNWLQWSCTVGIEPTLTQKRAAQPNITIVRSTLPRAAPRGPLLYLFVGIFLLAVIAVSVLMCVCFSFFSCLFCLGCAAAL